MPRTAQALNKLTAVLARVDALERELAHVRDELCVAKTTITRLHKEKLAAERRAEIAEAKLSVAERRIGELESKLLSAHKNSSTSSKASSTDSDHQPRRYSTRQRSDRPTGGQVGHEGAGRDWSPVPDTVVDHRPEVCSSCGGSLAEATWKVAERRQVMDVEVRRVITEHRVHTARCACGTKTRASFPRTVPGNISFGPGVRAGVLALSGVGKLPHRVTAELASAIFGIEISPGVLDTWRRQLAESLFSWDTRTVELLKAAAVVGADESPVRVTGMKNAHAHVAVTEKLTRFHLAGRKKDDITSGGILENHTGRLVTDCLPSYWSIGVAAHQACLAHLIRELTFFDEAFAPDPATATPAAHPHRGFSALAALLSESIHHRNEAATSGVPPGTGDFPARFDALVEGTAVRFKDHPHTRTDKDALALLRRLSRLAGNGELFCFMEDLEIPPTNNASEQALRPWKVRQRRSGCFRSEVAAREWLRIAGYLDTARKNGVEPICALRLAVIGDPVMP